MIHAAGLASFSWEYLDRMNGVIPRMTIILFAAIGSLGLQVGKNPLQGWSGMVGAFVLMLLNMADCLLERWESRWALDLKSRPLPPRGSGELRFRDGNHNHGYSSNTHQI
ncbi:hypothetical protein BDW42DRAFT_164806 [Aspergillus taichungensis]|uniref:Uncharacterized protein n=1 Tax=Aspergillus taichungensis TaxID=482145 RepID=A0A2J5I0S9_9EURO|nr:hypothetical protein BDW42DRAFT_164806 [Aspergillus taichungensis]